MDWFYYVLALLIMLVGLVGCILPLLPGPPLCYLALLLLQLTRFHPFSTKFLIVMGVITAIVTALDYFIPLFGTKKFGGSKFGVWGCTIGLVAGLFFPPWGIIVGPFAGAFIGEMIASNNSNQALKAAWGAFVGFLLGTLLKLVLCVMMFYYFIKSIIDSYL